jgi:DNA-binding LacI/PurR family transcriptional regulator
VTTRPMRGRHAPLRAGVMDVAEAAGVSAMTVSRVVNRKPGVGPATRARVLEVMQDLGFVPNNSARALRVGRSRALGVICMSTSLHGPSHVLFGVEQAAREEGYATIVVTFNGGDSAGLGRALEQLRRSSVEAVIVVSPLVTSGEALRTIASDLPILAIWAPSDVGIAVAGTNHFGAAYAATRHLLELGHATVWHVSGPLQWTGSEQRLEGWRAALRDAMIKPPPVVEGDWSAHSGYVAGLRILRETNATGIFAANDQMALGVYRAAHECRRRIPDELSVVGYDDDPDSAYYTPPLTTVHQDFEKLGARAFATIHSMMTASRKTPVAVPNETPVLLVRASTAPPPGVSSRGPG